MKIKKFQLLIKNIETGKYTTKEVSFREEEQAVQYFEKYWNKKYYTLIDINEMFEDDDISVGDLVEVIHTDGDYCTENLVKFIGQKGIVIDIDPNWDYPYLIRFTDEDFEKEHNRGGQLWVKDNLRAV